MSNTEKPLWVRDAERNLAVCTIQGGSMEDKSQFVHASFVVPASLHKDTAALVASFAEALAQKLYNAQKKYGYSNGWTQDDWLDECRQKLLEHLSKGDPRDVAAYCAFLWWHGEPTSTLKGKP